MGVAVFCVFLAALFLVAIYFIIVSAIQNAAYNLYPEHHIKINNLSMSPKVTFL